MFYILENDIFSIEKFAQMTNYAYLCTANLQKNLQIYKLFGNNNYEMLWKWKQKV